MPSTTPKQARTMAAVAHGWKPTGAAAGIPEKVAKEYNRADTGTKMLKQAMTAKALRRRE